ncbi:hypothetical protein MKX03_027386 [Papaver bracteatum]|nr:hypothetical protein MKX03_027386 [Papaver bracteatum]
MTSLCFSDEDSCGTKTGTGTGTGTPGTRSGASPGINTGSTPKPTDSPSKTLPIALGVGIPVFVIFWAIVAFLAIDHQKRKAAMAAAAAQGQTIEISGRAMPVDVDTEKQMHPTVKAT